MSAWADGWFDFLDWLMGHVFMPLVALFFLAIPVGLGWWGVYAWRHRHDPPDPWTCLAEHLDHYQPQVMVVGKVTTVTQTPVYACSISAKRIDDSTVQLFDGERTLTLRAPFRVADPAAPPPERAP